MTIVFMAAAGVFVGVGAVARLKYGASLSDSTLLAFFAVAALATGVLTAVAFGSLFI